MLTGMVHPSVPVQPALSADDVVERSAPSCFVVRRGTREVWRGEAINEAHALELAEQHVTDQRVYRLARRYDAAASNGRDRRLFADGAAYGRAHLARQLRQVLADNDGPALAAAIDALCTMFEFEAGE